MTITIDLPPDVEQKFLAEVQTHGISLDEFVQEMLIAHVRNDEQMSAYKRPAGKKSLAQLFAESPLKGLDLDFSRSQDNGRPIEL